MNKFQLTNLEVVGFKSIQDAKIDFGMVNILIGSNGSGKTNLISLFSLLQAMIEGRLQSYVAKKGGPDTFLHWGRKKTEALGAKFYFGNNGYGFILEATADNRLMIEDEVFYWTKSDERSIGGSNMESVWREGTHTGIDQYVKPILEKQKWRVYHFHDTGDTALVKQVHGINDNIELAADARNLAAFLYRLQKAEEKSYHRIVSTIQMAAPYFDDFILRANPLNTKTLDLEWRAKGSDLPFTASQLSDGTLRFICLAVLLLQPAHLQPETILIDEPELGLHPYAIQLLAALIKKTSQRKQIIVSTQSVELLNEFQADDVIVVEHKDTASTFRRLNGDELSFWLAEDYTLGDLWKRNILGGRP
ncbi:AAA family ATPase [Selenomonas sp.]|uniref:AAA family ATPase n=1 Tax=Selenomonas sp. TaxID=2053611 RepID=UPI003FA255BC